MLPNFLVIGAMKSGTTSLFHHLKDHPEIFMPANKEPGYFSDPAAWARGIAWYEQLFGDAKGHSAVGEASTNYSKYPYFPNVPERIAGTLPDVKLIYVVRPPVERIYSHYLHNYFAGRENRPADDALLNEPAYLQVSQYYAQLECYLHRFAAEQIKVVLLEDLRDRPMGVVAEVFRFLGVAEGYRPTKLGEAQHVTEKKSGRDNLLMRAVKQLPVYHDISSRLSPRAKASMNWLLRSRVPQPSPLSREARDVLITRLRPDVMKLSEYLQRDLSDWLETDETNPISA